MNPVALTFIIIYLTLITGMTISGLIMAIKAIITITKDDGK